MTPRRRVHLRAPQGDLFVDDRPACDPDRIRKDWDLTSDASNVSCRRCKKTHAWRETPFAKATNGKIW